MLIAALILGLCVWRTHDRLKDWRSDAALWRAAVQTAPQLSRPMVNLAGALTRQGHYAEAWALAQQAAPVIPPEQRKALALIVRWLDTVWQPVCDDPRWRSWCAWELAV